MKLDPFLYEQDFYTWTEQQAHALARHQLESLDWEHLADELPASQKSRSKKSLAGSLGGSLVGWSRFGDPGNGSG